MKLMADLIGNFVTLWKTAS